MPGAGCRMPDAGCRMPVPDAGCRMPDGGCRAGAGCRMPMPDAGCRMPDAGCRKTKNVYYGYVNLGCGPFPMAGTWHLWRGRRGISGTGATHLTQPPHLISLHSFNSSTQLNPPSSSIHSTHLTQPMSPNSPLIHFIHPTPHFTRSTHSPSTH